jgi:hypothetical protein
LLIFAFNSAAAVKILLATLETLLDLVEILVGELR